MGNLFKRNMQYGDDGEANVALYSQNVFAEKATYSEATYGTVSGAISSMYDNDPTTGYKFNSNHGNGNTGWCKWAFSRKTKLRNIIAYVKGDDTDITLDGSNDDVSWTTIDSVGIASGAQTVNLLGTNITYKYIRIRSVGRASGNGDDTIFTIKGLI